MTSVIYLTSLHICIIWLSLACCYRLDDVCDADDRDCRRLDISGSSVDIRKGQCHHGPSLVRKHGVSFLKCIQECYLTTGCTAVNYRRRWKLCELIGPVEDSTDNNVNTDNDCWSSKLSNWPVSLAGECSNHTCQLGERCQKNETGVTCVKAYCTEDIPTIENARSIEKFGLSRDISSVFAYKCDSDYHLFGKPYLMCNPNGAWETLICCVHKDHPYLVMNGRNPRDCNAIPTFCGSGLYTIAPSPSVIFTVYCTMRRVELGSNWHTIQLRKYGKTNFNRTWEEYENGFGDIYSDLWLGNRNIHQLTSIGNNCLRIQMTTYQGDIYNVWYFNFSIGNASSKYQLSVDRFQSDGAASNNLGTGHNGMKFTTIDQDNDNADHNCAFRQRGGWWYKKCFNVNLNGLFGEFTWSTGIHWQSITYGDLAKSLKETTMFIRAKYN